MRGCIEEIFKQYNLTLLVMSQREVRKRRVLSWVTVWAESPPVCWGLRRSRVLMNAVLSGLMLFAFSHCERFLLKMAPFFHFSSFYVSVMEVFHEGLSIN